MIEYQWIVEGNWPERSSRIIIFHFKKSMIIQCWDLFLGLLWSSVCSFSLSICILLSNSVLWWVPDKLNESWKSSIQDFWKLALQLTYKKFQDAYFYYFLKIQRVTLIFRILNFIQNQVIHIVFFKTLTFSMITDISIAFFMETKCLHLNE